MRAADQWAESDDAYGSYTFMDENWEYFWDHWEALTGRTVKEKQSFFSCSC